MGWDMGMWGRMGTWGGIWGGLRAREREMGNRVIGYRAGPWEGAGRSGRGLT